MVPSAKNMSVRGQWNYDQNIIGDESNGQKYMILDDTMRRELLSLARNSAGTSSTRRELLNSAKSTSRSPRSSNHQRDTRSDTEANNWGGSPGRSTIRNKLRKKLFKDEGDAGNSKASSQRLSASSGKSRSSSLTRSAALKSPDEKDIVQNIVSSDPMMLKVISSADEQDKPLMPGVHKSVNGTALSSSQQRVRLMHSIPVAMQSSTKQQRHSDRKGQQMSSDQFRKNIRRVQQRRFLSESGMEQKSIASSDDIILRLAKARYDRGDAGINRYNIKINQLQQRQLLQQQQQQQQRKRVILNHIKLHIYDLIPNEMLIEFPFGCLFPIGKCFGAVNSSLHSLGTGVYHVGIEVNGIEYAFGACETPGTTGVFTCVPMRSPGYQYRTTIDYGKRSCIQKISSYSNVRSKPPSPESADMELYMDGREVIKQMAAEYMGADYDLLRKNCCSFASDAAIRLGVPESEVPSWFRNLAESGAMTQDAAFSTVEPINQIMSTCEGDAFSQPMDHVLSSCHEDVFAHNFTPLQITNDCTPYATETTTSFEDGFEVIPKRERKSDCLGSLRDILTVIEAVESDEYAGNNDSRPEVCERALTWSC